MHGNLTNNRLSYNRTYNLVIKIRGNLFPRETTKVTPHPCRAQHNEIFSIWANVKNDTCKAQNHPTNAQGIRYYLMRLATVNLKST